jgi:CubicO group peptidase (beta-lactamase class C family)
MRRRTLLLLLLSLLASAAFAQSLPAGLEKRMYDYLEAQAKLNLFTGSVLVAKGDQIVLANGVGYANRELEVPNGRLTKFRLGSLTKQFTAAAILLLEEAGKLSTADKACKFVESCPKAWEEITIQNLLTHTSGVPNFTAAPDYAAKKRESVTPLQLIDRFKDKPLDFPAGSRMMYSNSGYALLGVILERASGESYENYLSNHIFRVLGMSDTGYDRTGVILKNRAAGYAGPSSDLHNADFIDMSIPFAAGALYSTVLDLHKWDRALYGGRLLSKVSLEKMLRPSLNNYAYGLIVVPNEGKIFHAGGIDGFSTLMIHDTRMDLLVVVLGNFELAATSSVARNLLTMLLQENP